MLQCAKYFSHKSLASHHPSVMLQYLLVFLIHDYFVSNQPGGGEVGSRVASGRVRHCAGRVGSDNWLLESGRVGSSPDPGGSGRVLKIGPGNNSAV